MTLRGKVVLYLALIHVLMAAVALRVLWEQPEWLFIVEGIFVLSIVVSIRLIRALFVPLELIGTGAELINERDFTSRFHPIGQPEMDQLIEVYNKMIDQLREERLKVREQNELLGQIVEAAPGGILIADLDERIVEVNPSAVRLVGASREEILGRTLPEMDSTVLSAISLIAVGDSRVLAIDGGRRLKVHRAAFRDRGYERSFYLLEELTEELHQSERAAYEKLIRMMSHEVNNSVGAVGSLLASFRAVAEGLPEKERSGFLRALELAGDRLDLLRSFMDRLAEVVRLPEPELRPCAVDRLLEDILSLFEASFDEQGISCVWADKEALPEVALDKNQMERVFVNVIKNAAEAIGEGGTIAVTTGVKEGVGQVTIQDSGRGIPEDVRQQLFTPFFSTKRDGYGLGLTLVKEILGRHDFSFSLKNVAGSGARFTIHLG